mmetsp:Transcript_24157/g.66937  ORF Transcript_24157/g.66937 Transcript_24157/m.66937 type:complete len:214 (+) Transcript_24157:5130-5771(+)
MWSSMHFFGFLHFQCQLGPQRVLFQCAVTRVCGCCFVCGFLLGCRGLFGLNLLSELRNTGRRSLFGLNLLLELSNPGFACRSFFSFATHLRLFGFNLLFELQNSSFACRGLFGFAYCCFLGFDLLLEVHNLGFALGRRLLRLFILLFVDQRSMISDCWSRFTIWFRHSRRSALLLRPRFFVVATIIDCITQTVVDTTDAAHRSATSHGLELRR